MWQAYTCVWNALEMPVTQVRLSLPLSHSLSGDREAYAPYFKCYLYLSLSLEGLVTCCLSSLSLRLRTSLTHYTPSPLGQQVPLGRQTLQGGQIVFFNCLDLYHKSPDSGQRQYKSRA